ncbi:Formamidopyrimidine-DNA glycosylase [hydrothermal vent metagenome]|uniref:Formamidopyrimidine-DNA glycosylase n=1 Tax=hydrothermal vent metagenome TaxID=652676 RepID=A0A3B0RIY5_9ZZZZ
MPELPEVETVMRGLEPALVGQTIAGAEIRRANLRFPFPDKFAEKLTGRTIVRLERRAKYILAFLDDDTVWLSHLGMTGRFTVFGSNGEGKNLAEFYFQTGSEDAGQGKHDHVVLTLKNGSLIVYTDPRRFGVMDHFPASEIANHKLLANLGVEPLGNELHAGFLAKQFLGKKAPLKASLLDQKYIAGLGNIYVCEALFRAGLSPKRQSSTLSNRGKATEKGEKLISTIRACLNEAISAGGSTLSDYADINGDAGSFQQRFDVYDRENQPCRKKGCGGTVKRVVQSGRSTFYCPRCQK